MDPAVMSVGHGFLKKVHRGPVRDRSFDDIGQQIRRFTPAGFSLVFAALRGDQSVLMVWVSSRRASTR